MSDRRDVTVVFDGSFEGLLTIVHKKYYEKLNPDYIVNRDCFQHMLFTDYVDVETDYEKAETVMNAITKKISREVQETVYMAFCATDEARYINIFKYIILGFTKGREVDSFMKIDYVLEVQNYAKFVGRESHLFKGFTRFKEAKNGVYFAEIEPVNNIITFLAQHFADRFIDRAWIIYDTKRKLAAVSDGKEYIIAETALETDVLMAGSEDNYQELWRGFVTSIAIEGRKNKKLQTQLVPKRYRRFMTEFAPNTGTKRESCEINDNCTSQEICVSHNTEPLLPGSCPDSNDIPLFTHTIGGN